ncbi:MAG: GDP-L-fucose synthase [Acidiferrobacterales bacterium]|nr:GDP-L-fucose synthase [Acidiferrobacterales bacterium]
MKTVFVAGHNGMVGSALCRHLSRFSSINLLVRTRAELDLLDQAAVRDLFRQNKIDEVYLAAARVGGIYANDTYPADFIYQNLEIQNNVVHSAFESGVNKLLFLGSSCIYPKFAEQPMTESALLTGLLEPTNAPYAIAKIAGIKLCESLNRQHGVDYRSVMPTNLYGTNDNFHPENSHVIPALMRRFHEAKINQEPEVTVWGTGKVSREFLHVDDMAAASVFVMDLPREKLHAVVEPDLSHLNIGTGKDVTIRELAEAMKRATGFDGELVFDASKPDGTPRKLLDVSKINQLGWRHQIELDAGLSSTYDWFSQNEKNFRR